MMKTILSLFLILQISVLIGQEERAQSDNNLGINYFGELGLRPGFEIDYGIPLRIKESTKENKKRKLSQLMHLRPSFAYYFYNKNSNNFLFSAKLNYQLRFTKVSSHRHFSVEPYLKVGYLRKSLTGEIYQTTAEGFEEVNSAGTNSIVLGAGLDFGGYLTKSVDWLLGFDYFIENTEDQLILHRFVAKLGTRIKLNQQ